MTNAVRHCIECRFQRFETGKTVPPTPPPPPPSSTTTKPTFKDPLECILELTSLLNSSPNDDQDEDIDSLLLSSIKNSESVLQDLDIHRLRAILYRDVVRQDRNKTGKNVVIVVVNPSNIFFFLCFCMRLSVAFDCSFLCQLVFIADMSV